MEGKVAPNRRHCESKSQSREAWDMRGKWKQPIDYKDVKGCPLGETRRRTGRVPWNHREKCTLSPPGDRESLRARGRTVIGLWRALKSRLKASQGTRHNCYRHGCYKPKENSYRHGCQ